MPAPIKLKIGDDGEIYTDDEFVKQANQEEAEEEERLRLEDPENYIHKCFHGKKCKHVKMETDPLPVMICKIINKHISSLEKCPENRWEKYKENLKDKKVVNWYRRNRRLHYERCAEEWKKRYGSTRKLPDYIVNGMQ